MPTYASRLLEGNSEKNTPKFRNPKLGNTQKAKSIKKPVTILEKAKRTGNLPKRGIAYQRDQVKKNNAMKARKNRGY